MFKYSDPFLTTIKKKGKETQEKEKKTEKKTKVENLHSVLNDIIKQFHDETCPTPPNPQ